MIKLELAMKLGGEYRLKAHRRATWPKVATELGLDESRVVLRVREPAEHGVDALVEVARDAAVEDLRSPLPQRLITGGRAALLGERRRQLARAGVDLDEGKRREVDDERLPGFGERRAGEEAGQVAPDLDDGVVTGVELVARGEELVGAIGVRSSPLLGKGLVDRRARPLAADDRETTPRRRGEPPGIRRGPHAVGGRPQGQLEVDVGGSGGGHEAEQGGAGCF